jgi:hypothetical protein
MKKTKSLKITLIFISLITIIFACNKSSKLSPTVESQVSNTKIKPNKLEGPCPYDCLDSRWIAYQDGYCGDQIVTNPNNPYDYIGQLHNQGIAAVFNPILANTSANPTYGSIMHSTNAFLSSIGYDTTLVNSALNYSQSQGYIVSYPNETFGTNPDSLRNKAYNNGLLSSTAKNYWLTLFSIVDNTIGSDDAGDSDTYNSFANEVLSLENQISNNSSLSSLELAELQQGCSVARYSAAYWGNFILSGQALQINSKKPVSLLSINSSSKLKLMRGDPFSWRQVLVSDIAGAVGGAIGGAVVGAWFGGGGALPGLLAGGVGGMISGSAGNAVYQLLI